MAESADTTLVGASGDDSRAATLLSDRVPKRPVATLARGTALGRYVVVGRLGAGGMGVVYAAYDPELDRKVALKLLLPGLEPSRGSTGETRLVREAQAMARVAHPNVIAVHDVGKLEGAVFIAMELVEGGTVSDWLTERRRSWREVLDIFVQAARGLAAAHDAGLVHRDFKPDNVLIGREGRARVTDFGLARPSRGAGAASGDGETPAKGSALDTELTRPGAFAGTPAYMAPEHHEGAVDARSDQFSFCVALWEGLYGARPFSGDSLPALFFNVSTGAMDPPPPDTRVPRWLHRALLRGLSVQPGDRFPRMDDLIERLVDHPTRLRRRRVVGTAVGGLAIASAAVLYASERSQTRCPDPTERLDGIWDAGRRDEVRAAMMASDAPFAADSWQTARRLLDGWVDQWAAQQREVCEASHGNVSSEELAVRASCLETRLDALEALVSVLAEGRPTVVERAVTAVATLESPGLCADVEALRTRPAPPVDPSTRENVEALERRLARAAQLDETGRYDDALRLARSLVEEADSVGYLPLRGRIELLLGTTEARRDDVDAGAAMVERAFETLVAAGDDHGAAQCLVELVELHGKQLADFESAERWQRLTEAWLARLGPSLDLELGLLSAAGLNLRFDGDAAGSLRAFEEVLDRMPDDYSPIKRMHVLNNAATALADLARYPESIAYHRRALALAEELWGTNHPTYAQSLDNLAVVLADLDQIDEALEMERRAVAIRERALGPNHRLVGANLGNLGLVLIQAGDWDQALAVTRRALAVQERAAGRDHPFTANLYNNLGTIVDKVGSPDEARAAFEAALHISERVHGPANMALVAPLTNLGAHYRTQHDGKQAAEHIGRALEIARAKLDPGHPTIAIIQTNLATAFEYEKRYDEALELHRAALEIFEHKLGPESSQLSYPLLGIGRIHFHRKEPKLAIEPLEHALELLTLHHISETVPEARFILARTLWSAREDRDRARELGRIARDQYRDFGDEKNAAVVDAWLKQLPPS